MSTILDIQMATCSTSQAELVLSKNSTSETDLHPDWNSGFAEQCERESIMQIHW